MKKRIFRVLMGIAAIIAVFLIGSIVNIENDVMYLIGTAVVAGLISFGFFLGTGPKEREEEENSSEEDEN